MAKKEHIYTTNYIVQTLYDKGLYYFDIGLFSRIFNTSHLQASQIFKRLEARKFIIQVQKGKYILLGFEPQKVTSQPFFIATKIVVPSYVSYWSALNFHGLSEQVPRTVFVANTRKKASVVFLNTRYKYVKITPRKFWGYIEVRANGLSFLIADAEKAIIDSLDEPSYAGGVDEIFKCIARAGQKINIKRLMDYAIKFGNKSLISRLGYLLERLDLDSGRLKKFGSGGYVKLNPVLPRSEKWNSRWKINENISQEELFGWKNS
jgi:predicted transcriptional regulator of viral defense system